MFAPANGPSVHFLSCLPCALQEVYGVLQQLVLGMPKTPTNPGELQSLLEGAIADRSQVPAHLAAASLVIFTCFVLFLRPQGSFETSIYSLTTRMRPRRRREGCAWHSRISRSGPTGDKSWE